MDNKLLLKIIDVNFNRCREGLRVVEDIYRFFEKDNLLRRKIRALRHSLTDLTADRKFIEKLVASLDVKNDIGKGPDSLEMKREKVYDITYANFQRAKEAARVIEEVLKIVDKNKVLKIKKIRFEIYKIEKLAFKRISAFK